MRVNIAWAELQRGKGKTTVFLVRSHPLLANNCGATTCLFSLSHRSGENPSYRSRKFVELTKTHISSHYFLQAEDPDPYQNVTNPEHCLEVETVQAIGQGNLLNLPRLISPATIFSKLLLSSSSYK
jgi:hypothetical protein